MKVVYKTYEPNKGLEEVQATIYNHNNGSTVTTKDIIDRYQREKIDPATVRYALTVEGSPIAYCQARDYPQLKETHIGYPWALPKCPAAVQKKLFNDLFDYMLTRKETLKLCYFAILRFPRAKDFIKGKNFIVDKTLIRLEFSLAKLQQMTFDEKCYSYRFATTDDIELLTTTYVDTVKARGGTADVESTRNYFSKTLLPNTKTLMVFEGKRYVCGGAPSIFPTDPDRVQLRFHMSCVNHDKAYIPLLIGITKVYNIEEWGKKPVFFNSEVGATEEKALSSIIEKKVEYGYKYVFKGKK